jgi:hypothetical protein
MVQRKAMANAQSLIGIGRRNREQSTVHWQFTPEDARIKR